MRELSESKMCVSEPAYLSPAPHQSGTSVNYSNLGKRDWSKDEVTQLISTYQGVPCLWDPSCSHYKDRTVKATALDSLAAQFSTTVCEITRKIHNLRNQFNSEMKKFKLKGTVSNWPHFDSLKFLEHIMEQRRSPHFIHNSIAVKQEFTGSGSPQSTTDRSLESDYYHPLYNGHDEEPFVQVTEDELSQSTNHGPTASKKPKIIGCDDCDIFGAYVASELRSLSTDKKRKALRRMIQKAILSALEDDDKDDNEDQQSTAE